MMRAVFQPAGRRTITTAGRWQQNSPTARMRLKDCRYDWHHHRRRLHLAPPFLLDDDYVPRHQLLSSRDAAKKRSLAYAHLRNCNLCPRECGVNRYETTGMCLIGANVKVNTIAPHFGEGML